MEFEARNKKAKKNIGNSLAADKLTYGYDLNCSLD